MFSIVIEDWESLIMMKTLFQHSQCWNSFGCGLESQTLCGVITSQRKSGSEWITGEEIGNLDGKISGQFTNGGRYRKMNYSLVFLCISFSSMWLKLTSNLNKLLISDSFFHYIPQRTNADSILSCEVVERDSVSGSSLKTVSSLSIRRNICLPMLQENGLGIQAAV